MTGGPEAAALHQRDSSDLYLPPPRLPLTPLQNKEFVCRGYDYERLEDFQQRMLGEFPQAIAMQHPNQPDDTILQSDAQCILPRIIRLSASFADLFHDCVIDLDCLIVLKVSPLEFGTKHKL